jgi:HTH-type transcriptional regulator, sugar sensing transcriptional regulator
MLAVEELRAFGLSAYEAQAYTTLLALGPTDATTLGQRAGIPFGRVYDVLHTLVGRNLAQVREGRPKLFVPAPPREALEALLHARKRDLAEQAERLGRLAPTLEEELRRLGRAAQLRSTPYTVTLGRHDARLTLAEVVGDAKQRILAALEFERYEPGDKMVFEAIQGAVERGVAIRALLRPQDLQRILGSDLVEPLSKLALPYLGEGLDVRVAMKPMVPFSVTDNERVTLGVRDPVHPDQHFAVIVLKDPQVAADLTGRFETLWREGRDLWDALEEGLPDGALFLGPGVEGQA